MIVLHVLPRPPRQLRLPPRPPAPPVTISLEAGQLPYRLRPSSGRPRNSNFSLAKPQNQNSVQSTRRQSVQSRQDQELKIDFRRQPSAVIVRPSLLSERSNPNPPRKVFPLLGLKSRNGTPPQLSAKSWAIYDIRTKQLIDGKKQGRRREIASLTKVMTLLTAMKELQRMQLAPQNIMTTVTRNAAGYSGTTASLKSGFVLSLLDLFYGMMLPSGNDAAVSVAELVGGMLLSERQRTLQTKQLSDPVYSGSLAQRKGAVIQFLHKMNDRASEIGMVNSFFTNPTGLSQKTNLSTAEDMCKAVTEAMQSDAFRTIVGTKQYVCCSRNDPSAALTWDNTNKLLAEGWDGVKTGVTPNAGPCLSCSTRGVSAGVQFEVGIVLLQCVSMEARWEEAKLLLQYALERRINY